MYNDSQAASRERLCRPSWTVDSATIGPSNSRNCSQPARSVALHATTALPKASTTRWRYCKGKPMASEIQQPTIVSELSAGIAFGWLRGMDLNHRPLGY